MIYAMMLKPGDDPWLALSDNRLSSQTIKPDNLKRISGIGKVIERELNDRGYFTYAQIAAWTENEVEKISGELALYKRITREKWVQQADTLSRGGLTPFARNVDRQNGDALPGCTTAAALAAARATDGLVVTKAKK